MASRSPNRVCQMSLSTFPMARPRSSMSCSLKAPSSRPSRDLSTEWMCSVRALVLAPIEGIETSSGKRSAAGVVVRGTMTTVPRRWLMRVSDKMAQGRVLACSRSCTGSSWIQYTWPRWYAGVMPCHAARVAMRSARPAQWQLPEKMFPHQNLNPSLPRSQLNRLPAILGFRPEVPGLQLQVHSWLHRRPSAPDLLCPARVAPDRPKIDFVAAKERRAPICSLHHQASVATPVWVEEFEFLT
jgi:hypothetical protein